MVSIRHCREDGSAVPHFWDFTLLTMVIDAIARDLGDTSTGNDVPSQYAQEGWRALMSVGTYTFTHDITIVAYKVHQPELVIKAGDYLEAWR